MNELDISAIEKETRYLVDLVNQNPMAFASNEAGIPAIPLEIAILAMNFAGDKDRRAVKAYESWLTNAPEHLWQETTYNGESDVYIAQVDLQGLSPANVHSGFIQAIQKHTDKLPNLIQLTDDLQHRRQLFGEVAVGSAIPMDDYRNVLIFGSERLVQNRMKTLVEDIQELNRPKTDLELELDAIREEFNTGHSDIHIEPGQYEKHEFKKFNLLFAGKDDSTKDKIAGDLRDSLQRLLDRLDSPDVSPAKKWITATYPFKAYNVATNYQYNAENSTLAEMYCEEEGYETGCFISPKEAFARGLSVDKGTPTHFFVQRFPVDVPAFELKNGEKVPKLKEDGTQDSYRIYTIGYSKMYNISQLNWKGDADQDPRKAWIEKYKASIEKVPCNQEQLEAFKGALLGMNYVNVKFGQAMNAYSPSEDTILMKNENQFRNTLRFVHTYLHELAHSTGHKDRQARQTLYDYHLDTAIRGQEELIANRVAALLIDHYGLHESDLKDSYEANNEVYDLGWARRVYEKYPLAIMGTIGSASYAFKELKEKIDVQLKLTNTHELFVKQEIQFNSKEIKEENSNDKPSNGYTKKSTYKRRISA